MKNFHYLCSNLCHLNARFVRKVRTETKVNQCDYQKSHIQVDCHSFLKQDLLLENKTHLIASSHFICACGVWYDVDCEHAECLTGEP